MDERKSRGRFVDTNIFLYTVQAHPKFGEKSKEILSRIEGGEKGVTSLINLAEICWWMEKHKKEKELEEIVRLISSILNLEIVPLTLKDFFLASRFITSYSIDFNDCLCLAVMKRLGLNMIYSNDSDFDKVEWIKREF
jgi:predicted nucleic acid-binding protein